MASKLSKRDMWTAARVKEVTQKIGNPDLMIPVGRGGWHGLAVIIKARRGRLSDKQKAWLDWLANQGWKAIVLQNEREMNEYVKAYSDERS